ncbi:MAG: hypothetical protein IK052_01950 [Bacteroidales bacterium]|nr:hypothetical protein [Bacteroidales bacterium]
MKRRLLIVLCAALAITSCKSAGRFQEAAQELFRGEVVARAGDHKLHRGELEKFIPAGVSPEDSAGLAARYIKAWAEDLLMVDMAEAQLSASEKDVSTELEQYRRALLKYRYEQLYINQRLDTLVTDAEIEEFYANNASSFILERPVIKARYLIIPSDSRLLKRIKSMMSSADDTEVTEAEQLAYTAAIKYADMSDTWMDAITLGQELGVDYKTLLSSIKNGFSEIKDDSGNLHLAYIVDMIPAGKTAPLEYCRERISDLVLSARRHNLQVALEESLLEDARKNNKFVTY